MTMTNRYDASKPEHTVTCTRTACAERPTHQAGLHLDQRSPFYDGPATLFDATSLYVRDSARKIAREAPELTPEVVDLVTYVEFLRGQVAHVQVDKDRQVRRAMARSGDCEVHGEEIKGLGEQLAHFDDAHRRADAGRVALLGFLHVVDEMVREHKAGKLRADLTVADLVAAIAKGAEGAHRAHERAWKR